MHLEFSALKILTQAILVVSILSFYLVDMNQLHLDKAKWRATYLGGINNYSKPVFEYSRSPDTTAVILNWSRLPNVIQLVKVMCHSLQDTLSEVFIWNNNPRALSNEDFAETRCPTHMLKIYNSPENVYFQARFLACAQSTSPYCFVQDDDYFVRPSIVRALRARITEVGDTSLHLLPPHEMLYSVSSTIEIYPTVCTLFAWLGYGTMVKRSHVQDFLAFLDTINADEETLKMADNYFTVLSNRLPELWFDQNHELGGGSPFTVGIVGEERNNRHIIHAGRILDSLALEYHRGLEQNNTFVTMPASPPPVELSTRAACADFPCVMETNIKLLLEPPNRTVSSASEIVSHVSSQFQILGTNAIERYINCSPSFAVDADAGTYFCSAERATKGDWIALDWMTLSLVGDGLEFAVLVDMPTEEILRNSRIEASVDGSSWQVLIGELSCFVVGPVEDGNLRECSVGLGNSTPKKVRIYLERNISHGWTIHDMWLRQRLPL